MKTLVFSMLTFPAMLLSALTIAQETVYSPFVLASSTTGSLSDVTGTTVDALVDSGFEIAGQYSPVEGSNLIVITSKELKEIAAMSERGGYAAGQRVAVTQAGDRVEVSFMNPLYLQHGYRLNGDMQLIASTLSETLGYESACGAGNKKMTAKKLGKYRYMLGMERFDNPSDLGSFESYEAAVNAVEEGLAREGDALSQVYRIDIPGKEQTVFGVAMHMTNDDEKDIDSAYQMSIVDFEGCKKRAYFPYEVLVNGRQVEALHMRFRMALHFPNLSMMGEHGFTQLITAPGSIEDALQDIVSPR